MTERLKVYVKAHHGLSFKIDPDLIIRKLDNDDASIIYEDKENLSLIDYLVSIGYKHRGFTTRFSESSPQMFFSKSASCFSMRACSLAMAESVVQ